MTHRRLTAAALLVAMAAAACGGTDNADGTADDAATATTSADDGDATDDAGTTDDGTVDVDTTAGVEAAQWGDNVTITLGDGVFRYEADGVPNHELADAYAVPTVRDAGAVEDGGGFEAIAAEEIVVETPIDVEIPTTPVWSDTPTDTGLGLIGVIVSGAQLFNDYEDMERTLVAVDDNFEVDGASFIDACNGHTAGLDNGGGSYHYHGVPYCITDTIDVEGEHSTVLGFLVDGYPFYGNKDEGGEVVTSDDLDECSGHVGPTPEFPEGIYHYHLTDDRSPYTIDCYHGEVEATGGGGQGGGPGEGGPPDGPPPDEDQPGDGGDDDADEAGADETGADETGAEAADLEAVVLAAAWADDVEVTVDGDEVTVTSDGIPAHEYLDQYLGDGPDGKFLASGVEATPTTFTFPLVPTIADSPTATGNGTIGIVVSGAVFFDPYEGDGSATVANDDNATIDGVPFIDACGGHPLPNGTTYHYHGIPFCVTDALDTDGEHSQLIGFMGDGHGVYGPQDVDGEAPDDLDACLGHVGLVPGLDEPVYHYHVSAEANYISECLVGEVAAGGRPR